MVKVERVPGQEGADVESLRQQITESAAEDIVEELKARHGEQSIIRVQTGGNTINIEVQQLGTDRPGRDRVTEKAFRMRGKKIYHRREEVGKI